MAKESLNDSNSVDDKRPRLRMRTEILGHPMHSQARRPVRRAKQVRLSALNVFALTRPQLSLVSATHVPNADDEKFDLFGSRAHIAISRLLALAASRRQLLPALEDITELPASGH